MDPYRLPRHIMPTRYEIRIEPDLTAKTFEGEETISLTVLHPASEIVLNAAAELEISEAQIENESGILRRPEVKLEEETERCRFCFPDTILPGKWRLRLRFKGYLTTKDGGSKLEGFYRSTYKDASGAEQWLATTQFEPTAARQAFPCWDEPVFKAVFALTLVIDYALKAVSNTAVLGEYPEGNKKVVRFADTIPMSTYLVAFVVGDLQATEPTWVGKTPLRVWYVPDTPDKHRLAAFGQQIGKISLEYFEEYYGQPYPGDKLDLIAIPDFAAGAMENLGAVTFRQTSLLADEHRATHTELERVAETVAHENAHMWFGDLVTMAWWDGLWLNEAFATFMSILPVDRWKPEWQRWTTFGLNEREAGLVVDGLHSTRPVEFLADDPRDIEAMFDDLTYRKGASVLRMLEQYLAPDVFRAGIREYLRQHAYGNASTDDLWAALGQAAGRDVGEIMNGWVRQPGYPLVSVGLDKNTQQLVLAQQRFTYLKEPLPALVDGAQQAAGEQDQQHWQVPIQLHTTAGGETTTRQLLLKDAEERLELPKNFESLRANESGYGFYRVYYDPELREGLLRQLPDLSPIERLNFVKDTWAMVLAENDSWRIPLSEYLDLAARLAEADRDELDKNVWAWSILIQSFQVLNRIIDPNDRPNLETFVRHLVEPAFNRLGWEPHSGESALIPQLRADLLRTLGTLGNHHEIQNSAVEAYDRYKSDPAAMDGNIVAAVIQILAYAGDARRYEEFFNNYLTAATTPQDKQRYLYALAAFRQPDLLQKTLDKTIQPRQIRPQDAFGVVQSLLMNVYGRELAWEFVKHHWEDMSQLYRQSGLSRVCAGVVGLTTPEWESDVNKEVRKVKIGSQTLQEYLGGKTLEQNLERLRVFVEFRKREIHALHDYLAQVPT